MFELITPISYWILTILWLVILGLYLVKLRQSKVVGGAVAVLITILAIDAFRTVFESVYFGLYFNSMFGLLPNNIYAVLSQPALIIIPKLINVAAGLIVLFLLIRRWVPREIQEQEDWVLSIQEAKRVAEEQREEAEHQLSKFEAIFNGISDSIVFSDIDRRVISINHGMEKTFGYSIDEIVGKKTSLFYESQEEYERQGRIRFNLSAREKTEPYEVKYRRKDGEVFVGETIGTVIKGAEGDVLGYIGVVRDITERTHLQATMIQTEKMMTVGGMAAGMAHEINNPLSGILQGVENVRRRLSVELPANLKVAEELGLDFEKMQEYLKRRLILEFFDSISDSGLRASTIVVNMLGFSRKAADNMELVNVSEMIDQAIKLAKLDYDLKKKYDFKDIDIQCEFSSDLPCVLCLRGEIQQVLLNLFSNASHAFQMKELKKGHPQISIRTAQDGDMVLIEVADNGPGMSEDVSGRVFEPFFTTKPTGEGTGLGLSIAYYIIHDQHHGRLEVDTTPGQGATFKIWLPLKQEN